MAALAAILKPTPESRPGNRAASRAAPKPFAEPRPRRSKGDDRLSLIALAPKAGEIILDLGCGTGRRFGAYLQARSLAVGIDAALPALRSAQKKFPQTACVQSAAWEALPFANSHFDAVLCTLTGEHLEHMHAVLRELHRILKPGGRIVLALHYPKPALAGDPPAMAPPRSRVQDNLVEVDLALRRGAFRHTVRDYVAALQATGCVDVRQHQTQPRGRQQSLFPEENPRPEEEFPALVVLQARRAR